ncbi:MAG: hypothetical protein ABSF70_17500 [Terracidiphilus sp.]
MMQVPGHHVFQQHAKANASSREGQPTTQRTSSDYGDGFRAILLFSDDREGFGGQCLGDIVGTGAGLDQVLGDARALLSRERGNGGQYPAQGYGNIIDVIHQANGFSGERHGFPRK